jgi:hypothetical protein
VNLYTSTFNKAGTHPQAIAVCKTPPPEYTGRHLPILAPPVYLEEMLDIDDDEYVRVYLQVVLANINPVDLVQMFTDGSVLLCFDHGKRICHRHIIAQYITQHTGIKVNEL